MCSPSPKGGIGKSAQKRGSACAKPTPSARQPLFETPEYSGAKKEPQSQKITRTAPKSFLNNSRGLPGRCPVKQGKGFEANRTRKFTRTFGKIFVTQFLCGTYSVPKIWRATARLSQRYVSPITWDTLMGGERGGGGPGDLRQPGAKFGTGQTNIPYRQRDVTRSSFSGLQKGPAERGHVKKRRKSSKSVKSFSTIFDHFRAGKKTSKSVKKVFSTLFDYFRAGQKKSQKSSKSVKNVFLRFSRGTIFFRPRLGGSESCSGKTNAAQRLQDSTASLCRQQTTSDNHAKSAQKPSPPNSVPPKSRAHSKVRKILAPIKIKSALPPPKTENTPPPLKRGILWTGGFSCRKNAIFPRVRKIGAAIPGPRIADTNFTDTRIFF